VGSQRLCEGIRAQTKSRAKFNKDVKIRPRADFFLFHKFVTIIFAKPIDKLFLQV
jgi:hypothetical protein